jgi:hypothetical protein
VVYRSYLLAFSHNIFFSWNFLFFTKLDFFCFCQKFVLLISHLNISEQCEPSLQWHHFMNASYAYQWKECENTLTRRKKNHNYFKTYWNVTCHKSLGHIDYQVDLWQVWPNELTWNIQRPSNVHKIEMNCSKGLTQTLGSKFFKQYQNIIMLSPFLYCFA